MKGDILLVVENVRKYFERGSLGAKRVIRAVDGVSFRLRRGETLGLVGESGSGKSTLGRLVLRLYKPTSGRIIFEGIDITDLPESKLRPLRRKMQLVPQDPYASFNPLQTIGETLIEPLLVHGVASSREQARDMALKMLEKVGLVPPEEFFDRRPYLLSGGQLQRVAIARAMLLEPVLVVADEPTSSLDVSIRASILELLQEFKRRLNQSMIFITHDLATARLVSDTIAVMYLGKIVEYGPAKRVLENPLHPYTAALLTAIPRMRPAKQARRVVLAGEIPDPSSPPPGCRLHPRCPYATDVCRRREPELVEAEPGHWVACHHILSSTS
ncbi:MAG: ABC transporter ATP-binding protein [Pyrodictiaceae archaeon]